MVDIVIRGLTQEQFKQLRLLKVENDAKTWKEIILKVFYEWKAMKQRIAKR